MSVVEQMVGVLVLDPPANPTPPPTSVPGLDEETAPVDDEDEEEEEEEESFMVKTSAPPIL